MQKSLLQAEERLQESDRLRQQTSERLNTTLRVTQEFMQAGDENEIIEMVLNFSMQMTGAMGASFVPLDERGQPSAAIRRGEFPFPVPDAWLEYLASNSVRHVCQQCTRLEDHSHTCALLKGPFSEAMGLYCFPMRVAERDLGMLNLYLPDATAMQGEPHAFLRSLADATALALEGERLRRRELETLSKLGAMRSKTDLNATFQSMLENLIQTIDADFALLLLPPAGAGLTEETLSKALRCGSLAGVDLTELHHLAEKLWAVEQAGISSEKTDPVSGLSAWLAAPLLTSSQQCLGLLLIGSQQAEHFHQRHQVLAQGVAEQIILLLQNSRQLADLEYKAMMDERTRLAREIHDGLAQTLGFLKLQVAQMLAYVQRNEPERLPQALKLCYETLASAYQDARQAIDGLRISPQGADGYSLQAWLQQTVEEYAPDDLHDFRITVSAISIQTTLLPELHAQLIRIVQEALSNVRKHAHAHQVWISCVEAEGDLILEIRDDGQGFAIDDIPGPSRYGLRGMRERAELIGADFQVISWPEKGTTIRVRLPLQESKRLEV